MYCSHRFHAIYTNPQHGMGMEIEAAKYMRDYQR